MIVFCKHEQQEIEMAIAKKKAQPTSKSKAKAKSKPAKQTKPVTLPTKTSVKDFIAQVGNDTRRADAEALLNLFAKVSGWKARMWGPTIVGFGVYHYTYESGRTGTSPVIGFSPRTANLVVYVFDYDGKAELLNKLGKHKGGIAQCLYINKLIDIDTKVLAKVLEGGIKKAKQIWPVTDE
jgi:hypothetical protein